ncbi:hypothetical protein [Marimonas arenosa]|uniref:Uncharacterized protein n=1 Tax=Marimonas arenosa TaxID=1795305 RepID=A0AAE4B1Z5_9RHOB|nr:hypothetical protein [Marimonas arenosa]MDQ2088548.1 hypothetical protein [Marimonas arenosa]
MTRKVLNRLYNRWCRARLKKALPGIHSELADYAQQSDTTGTQWATLWWAVHGILTYKPSEVLECGTGASTLVLSAAVQKLRDADPAYTGRVTSMESVREWYDIAAAKLPEKYRDTAAIIHGPRELYEVGMFRGYIHGNIPPADYDFVFLDGPYFSDDRGSAFCADVFRAMELSSAPLIRGVIDGRLSSGFVLQCLFGPRAVRYWRVFMTATFRLRNQDLTVPANSSDFRSGITGRLSFRKFRE